MLRLTDSNDRDQALASLVAGNRTLSIDDARRLVDRIDSPELRFQAISNHFWQLAQHDRAQAEDWVRRSRLPSDQRDSLLEQLQQRQRVGYY